MLKTFGLSNLAVGFLTAVPYLIAAIGMVIAGRHSDATGERIWHVALPLFVSGAALRLVGPCRAASACHAGIVARHPRHLRRHRYVLVAADLDPDRHRCWRRGSR